LEGIETVREDVAEPVEAVLPRRPLTFQPLLAHSHSGRLDLTRADPALLLGPDQASGLENAEVLHDGGE
jgi:hypothetical protein